MSNEMSDCAVKTSSEQSSSGVFYKKKMLKFWSIIANIALVGIALSFIYARIIAFSHGYITRTDTIQANIYWFLPAICFFLLYFISMVAIACILINKAKTTIKIAPDGVRIQLSGLLSKTKTLDITGWKVYQVTQHSRHRKEDYLVLEVATKNGSFMFADDIKDKKIKNIATIEGGDRTIGLLSENNKSAFELAKFLGLITKQADEEGGKWING